MTNPTITEADRAPLAQYLLNRMSGAHAAPWAAGNLEGGRESLVGARKAFRTAQSSPESLATWCAKWLTDAGWMRAKAAVRQQRYNRTTDTRTVRLRADLVDRLGGLAESWGCTRSEALARVLDEYEGGSTEGKQ